MLASRRDPRAAPPLLPRKNITISASCQFYGVRDAISHCRYPRSCQDCLQTEGCFLSPSGACENASETSMTGDYRLNLQLYPSDSEFPFISKVENAFPAGKTTYCNASDPVCITCQERFHSLAEENKLGMQFCVGSDGCVCIGMCDVPGYRATKVVDAACGQPTTAYREEYVRPPLRTFTSSMRDPRAPPDNLLTQKKEETCAHYSAMDMQGNGEPRTCQDCLSRTGCAIDGFRCVDMTSYRPLEDFRDVGYTFETTRRNAETAMFPSTNTTYCPSTDPVCLACRARYADNDQYWQESWISYCIGQDDCVCIKQCESQHWRDNVPREWTSLKKKETDFSLTATAATTLVAWVVLWALYIRTKSQPPATSLQNQRRQLYRHMVDQAPVVEGQLTLSGWRGFVELLLYKEHQQLQGHVELPLETHSASAPELEVCEPSIGFAPSASSPPSAPHLDILDPAPTAPEMDMADEDETQDLLWDRSGLLQRSGRST